MVANTAVYNASLGVFQHGPGATEALIKSMLIMAVALARSFYGRESAPERLSNIVNQELVETDKIDESLGL